MIKTCCLGDWQTNCFVLHRSGGKDCWIIDAGFEPDPLIQYIQENNLHPLRVIQTHAHVDHIAGLSHIRSVWPKIPIAIHHAEEKFLTDPVLNLSIVLEEPVVAPEATELLEHGQTLELEGLAFEIRHTPGHSPGGVCLIEPTTGQAIVGDTLFAGSVGRTDFPTSNPDQLMTSIKDQLLTLPDKMTIHPGHGAASTIGHERANNPFIASIAR